MINKNKIPFTKSELEHALHMWNHASVSLLDIRHCLIPPNEPVPSFLLPANAFLYVSGPKAEVLLNESAYTLERFGLFHSVKGSILSLYPADDWLEYYLLLYNVGDELHGQTNPFYKPYGFAPSNPLFFMEHLRNMYERFNNPTPLNAFYGKTAFYQFVFEVYEMLSQESVPIFEPDIIMTAKRYLDRHYKEPVSIQDMCEMLGISYSSLYRNFKKKTGKTPQEYLIDTRLTAAKEWLNHSSASIREISEHCGFSDEHNFYRLFMKNFRVSPNAYRQISHTHLKDNAIGYSLPILYNEQGQVSLDKLKLEGVLSMYKQITSKAIAAGVFSLVLLLSACSSTPTNTGVGETKSTSSATTQISETKGTNNNTRIMQTALGDVEIPANPKRIVGIQCSQILENLSADAVDMKDLYELTYFSNNYNWEALMALEPDLIIASNYPGAEKFIERCKQIAPTVTFEDNATIAEKQLFVGKAANRLEKAEEQINTYNDVLAKNIQKLKDAGTYGKKVSIIQYTANGDMYSYGDKLGRGGDVLFKLLGFQATDLIQSKIIDGDEYYLQFSLETLPDYVDADYIIIMHPDNATNQLYENGVWKSLNAVKEGRFFEITEEEYKQSFDMPGIVQIEEQINLYTDRILTISK
jgi:iron complex transport system substrate-binding protein